MRGGSEHRRGLTVDTTHLILDEHKIQVVTSLGLGWFCFMCGSVWSHKHVHSKP